MSVEELVGRALAEHAQVVSGEPDVEAFVARGMRARRRHRTRIAAGVAAVAVIVGAAVGPMMWRDAESEPVRPPEDTAAVPPKNLGIPWGRDVTYYFVGDKDLGPPYGGRPFADTQSWTGVDFVQSLTTTSTGVVYLDANSDIVFEGWDHQTRVLGNNPRPDYPQGGRDYYKLVGNPSHDLVAWVEDEGRHAAVVVVRASTGERLARTVLTVPPEDPVYMGPVLIQSIDSERLYVLTNWTGGSRIWTWKWSTKDTPTFKDPRDGASVANGVWAVRERAGLRFETDAGRLLRRVSHSFAEYPSALSPDGKIWFNGAYKKFLDPATGRIWSLKPGEPEFPPEIESDRSGPLTDKWGWAGAAKITFVIDPPEASASPSLVSCNVLTLECTEPLHPQLPAGSFRFRDVTLPSQ